MFLNLLRDFVLCPSAASVKSYKRMGGKKKCKTKKKMLCPSSPFTPSNKRGGCCSRLPLSFFFVPRPS